MAYSKRNDYLKVLNNMRSNYQNNGNALINTMDDSTAVGEELSSFAYMNTPTPSMAEERTNVDSYKANRNVWQRSMDTMEELSSNVSKGFLEFLDGVGDFLIGISGEVGSWFGGDTQWAEDAISYDWVSQAHEGIMAFNQYDVLSGDFFQAQYYDDMRKIGNKEGANERAAQRHSNSFVSDASEEFQNIYSSVTEGIGYVLPSVVAGIATGGASSAVQAGVGWTMLGVTGTSAMGSGTEEALADGADYHQAIGSGMISGGIEVGTELASLGLGKIAGKILGKTMSYGTKISGTQFVDAISKASAKELGRTAIEEGIEELISELLSPFAKTTYKGTEAFDEYKDVQLYKDSLVSFLGGAVGGIVAGEVQMAHRTSRFSNKGIDCINELSSIIELREQAQNEAKKGAGANQDIISKLENQIGAKVKSYMTKMEELRTSNSKAFDNVIKLLKNPSLELSSLEKELNKSTYDSLAQEVSRDMSKMKNGKETKIIFGKEEDFELINEKSSLENGNEVNNRAIFKKLDNGTNAILIDPRYKSKFFEIVGHEAISHGLLDDTKGMSSLENYIKSNSKLNELFHSSDTELKSLYGTNEKTIRSERMAKFLENFISNHKNLMNVIGTNQSSSFKGKIKSILNNIKKYLDPRRDSKILHQIENAINSISTTYDSDLDVDIKVNTVYDKNTEGEYSNEFRRIQEESRRLHSTISQQHRIESFDGSLRNRVTRVLSREIRSFNSRNSYTPRLLDNTGDFKIYNGIDGNLFHDVFEIARTYLQNGELVDLHDNYNDATCYLSDDGLSGFAITNNGDLVSVYNLSKEKGFLRAIAPFIKENAKTLDCYVSPHQNLKGMYEAKFGFKTASMMQYNMAYDHDSIAQNHNMPKVAFMVNTTKEINTRNFNKNQYDEAKKYQLSFIKDYNDSSSDTKFSKVRKYMKSPDAVTYEEITNQLRTYFKNDAHTTKTDFVALVDHKVFIVDGQISDNNISFKTYKTIEFNQNYTNEELKILKGWIEDEIDRNGIYSKRMHYKIGYNTIYSSLLNSKSRKTVQDIHGKSSNNEGRISGEDGTNGGVKYSRILVSGVLASKDYAQHMQEKVLDLKSAKDIYNLVIEGISQSFDADIKIKGLQDLSELTAVSFNKLLNKPEKLSSELNKAIDYVLKSKIEYHLDKGKNQVASLVDTTLENHLKELGINIDEFKKNSLDVFNDILQLKSKDSKIKKISDYFNSRISSLVTMVKYHKTNSYYTIKAFDKLKTIKTRIENHTLPNVANKVGDIHYPELNYYKGLIKGIRLSKSKQGISPKSIDHIIANFSSYTQDNLNTFQWISFNENIRANVDFLIGKQIDGKFPNRALTFEENKAVLDILSHVSKDMSNLVKEETIHRHKQVQKADVETKVLHSIYYSKDKVNRIQQELDYASSIDTIVGRYFGTNSDTYRIVYKDIIDSSDKQLLKQWEFLGEYEKIQKELGIKDSELTKQYEFMGEKISMNTLLDIYCQTQTSIGLQTLQDGGYNFYNKNSKGKHLRLTGENINQLQELIPENIQSFANRVLYDLYNGSLKTYKSDADIKMKGYEDVIKDDVYYPTNKSEAVGFTANSSATDYQSLHVENTSINQARKNVTNKPLKGMAFADRFKAYCNAITKYGEMTQSLHILDTLMNQYTITDDGRRTPRMQLMSEIDKNFNTYLNYLKNQILGNPVDKTRIGNSKMFSNLVSSTLNGNVSVVLKQTASIPTIMMEVKFSSWVKGLVGAFGKLSKYNQTKANLKMQSGLLSQRWGDFDVLRSQTLSNNLGKIAKFFGVPMAKMDEAVIVMFGYSSAQYEAESLGFGKVGTDENTIEAINILNRIVTNTQSNAIPIKMSMNRAGATGFVRKALSYFSSDLQNKVNYINLLFNEKKIAKNRLAFINDKLAQLDVEIQKSIENNTSQVDLQNIKKTYLELKEDAEHIIAGGNDKKLFKLAIVALLSGIMISSIEQLVERLYGRKGWNEDTSKEFAISVFLESTVNNLPYLSTIINSIEYDQQLGSMDFKLIQSFIDIANNIREGKPWQITFFNSLVAVGSTVGLPLKNLYNLIMGTYKNVSPNGYELDAIIKGYSDTYLMSLYRDAITNGKTNQAYGNLQLVYTHKTGLTSKQVLNEVNSLFINGYNAIPKNCLTSYNDEKGNTISLTATQTDYFMKYYSQSNKEVSGLISLSDYKSLNNESKAKLIKKIYDSYYDYAKVKVLNATSTNKIVNLLNVTSGGLGLSKFVIGVNALSNIEATKNKTRKELVLEKINKMSGYTKAEKLLLVYLCGFSLSENNKMLIQNYLAQNGSTLKDAKDLIA